MNKEKQITLIIGEKIADKITKQEAVALKNSIKKLREESSCTIPPIHITDEIKIAGFNYEIKIDNDKKLVKNVNEDIKEKDLIKLIVDDIELICKE